jgi:TonB family protein
LDEVAVSESSGHDIFDKDAVNTAQILAPFDSFPPELELEELIITIPIVYSQDSASLSVACQYNLRQEDPTPFVASGKPYGQLVQERIARTIVYPKEFEKYGWEGTVKLNLRIQRDGTLAYATVKESSGYSVFDQCALKAAEVVAPYSGFPAESDLQEVNVMVPIVYKLKN